MQVFKGVVRHLGAVSSDSRGKKTKKKKKSAPLHRYMVVGVIVTNEPIQRLNRPSVVLAGECTLLEWLNIIQEIKAKQNIDAFSADMILTDLNEI